MSEGSRAAAAEGEAPVNPYSLLEAVNSSSETAHTAWLIFIAIMSYLLIAVAGVTHKDLLASSDIPLPVLQVKIDLTRFFLFAPIVLVLFHLGVISQLVMLARKTLEFDGSLRMLEVSEARTHPLRLELHNLFFVQAIAGPERSRVMSLFLHGMSWLTLVVLPVLLLLYIQVAFIPYHDQTITWAHRLALMADVGMLILIGVFLTRPEATFFGAFARMTRGHPASVVSTVLVLILVSIFSMLVATIPGEPLDRAGRAIFGGTSPTAAAFRSDRAAYGFVMPFFGGRRDGTLFGVFERNLNVTDQDLVVDKDVTPGEPTLVLRGRDLRYARLDRTDLHQADLTGADLEGASLIGADLRGVLLQCADINELILTDDRRAARCPNARAANFSRARLKEARLSGTDLREAKFEEADLEGADLSYANLAGASFYAARLERADLTGGVSLLAANLATAAMQGADLTGAVLQGADLTSAGLQGAVLAHAGLHGAVLRDADLEGADLYKARLQGADMRNARIRSATFREAAVWQTVPPNRETAELADFADLSVKPLEGAEASELGEASKRVGNERTREQLKVAVASLVGPDGRQRWPQSEDAQTWAGFVTASAAAQENYKLRLTTHLGLLACKPRWASGSVATGLAKRALGIEYRGDLGAFFDRIRADDCAGGKAVPAKVMRALATAADQAKP